MDFKEEKRSTRNLIMSAIEACIKQEQELSMKKFPLFNTPHEGYAILLEEYEEALEELCRLKAGVQYLWEACKENDSVKIKAMLHNIKHYTLDTITELIQVGAMAKKFEESFYNE